MAMVPEELEGANLTQDAARVAYTLHIHGTWLLYALKSAAVFAQLDAGALGATIRGAAGPLPASSRPGGPPSASRALPRARKRVPGAAAAGVREPRRAHRVVPLGGPFASRKSGAAARPACGCRGGFPPARTWPAPIGDSLEWRRQFIQTFLERDLPAARTSRIPATTLLRDSGRCSRTSTARPLERRRVPARSLGVSEPTVRRYLDLLTGALHGAPASAVAREPRQAPGQGAEGLLPRLRPPARTARHSRQGRSPVAPGLWRLVGGLRHRGGLRALAAGRSLLLGHALRRGDGSTPAQGWPAPRRRGASVRTPRP